MFILSSSQDPSALVSVMSHDLLLYCQSEAGGVYNRGGGAFLFKRAFDWTKVCIYKSEISSIFHLFSHLCINKYTFTFESICA